MPLHRPCLGPFRGAKCPADALVARGRCASCEAARQASRNALPSRDIYDSAWRTESLQLRAREPWCHASAHVSGCDPLDLTVDHPTRLVLSRSCHAVLENARRRAMREGRVESLQT